MIITKADDGSLESCQAHPTHNSRSGGADGLLAVVDAVDVSFVQAFQVRPESRLKRGNDMGGKVAMGLQVGFPSRTSTFPSS